jgi:hypothetical protein
MIAPKLVSHVQPSGRDYSATTSPDLITAVPFDCRTCGELFDVGVDIGCDGPCCPYGDPEAGRTTVGGALMVLIACFVIGFLFALAFLGAPTSDAAYRGCLEAFGTEIGAVTAMDELDCRDGLADGNR